MIPFSVLDLCPIVEGGSATQALDNTLDLASRAESWGYHRYWLAEHHNMPGIASAATSVLIGQVAARTSSIRVGAGGVMLPNHAPLVIAEQFGTLASLFPGRIDLGLGRAPGTDQATMRSLRRAMTTSPEDFPRDVEELLGYFEPARRGQTVRAIPGQGEDVPVWILGSSLFGAQLAADLGLPYAFASHFAPGQMMEALALYRARFRPSERLARPYAMLGYNVFAADTDEEAHYLSSSMKQAFLNLRRGRPTPLPPPAEDFDRGLDPAEAHLLDHVMACTAIGSRETVCRKIESFVAATGADELMITAQMHDHGARLHSYRLAADVWRALAAQVC